MNTDQRMRMYLRQKDNYKEIMEKVKISIESRPIPLNLLPSNLMEAIWEMRYEIFTPNQLKRIHKKLPTK